MTFLPIVERELREGARRNSTRYVRLAVAAVALAIALFQLTFIPLFTGMGRSSGSTGFSIMTGYAFLLCLLAGIFITADCLSEEKREGTLGLLFLTDLRGYDVVLGKLASQLVYLGYALVAIIPAAALPLLFGGVTGGEVWRMSLALMNLLFFALATGVFASTFCRQASHAMSLTAVLLVFFCFLLPLLQSIGNQIGPSSDSLTIALFSPAQAYSRALESGFLRSPGGYWRALAGSHFAAWALIALASWRLPHSWQERSLRAVAPAATPSVTDLAGNTFAPRTKRRRELLDSDPLLWLVGERAGVKATMILLTLLWGAFVLLVGAFDAMAAMFVGGWVYLFITKILFAAQACRFFAETRRAGAFELLLSTPITLDRLVSAQWTALRRAFGPPLIGAGCVCGLYLIVLIVYQANRSTSAAVEIFGVAWVFVGLGLLVEFLDFMALGHLGMWLALTMRKPHLATGATILFVLLLPLLTISCAGFIGLILDIILIAIFSSKLRTDLRQILLQQSASPSESKIRATP